MLSLGALAFSLGGIMVLGQVPGSRWAVPLPYCGAAVSPPVLSPHGGGGRAAPWLTPPAPHSRSPGRSCRYLGAGPAGTPPPVITAGRAGQGLPRSPQGTPSTPGGGPAEPGGCDNRWGGGSAVVTGGHYRDRRRCCCGRRGEGVCRPQSPVEDGGPGAPPGPSPPKVTPSPGCKKAGGGGADNGDGATGGNSGGGGDDGQ